MTLIAVAATIMTQQMTIAVLSMAALLVCTAGAGAGASSSSSTGKLTIGQQIDRLVKRTIHAIVHPFDRAHNNNLDRLLEEDNDNNHPKQDTTMLRSSSDLSPEIPSINRKLPFIQFGSPSITTEQQHGEHTRPSSSNGKRPGGSMVLTNTTTRAGKDKELK